MVRVLILEPTPRLAAGLSREPGEPLDLRGVASLAEALLLRERPGWQPQAILSELTLPDGEGAEIVDALGQAFPTTPLLFATGEAGQLRRQLQTLAPPSSRAPAPRPLVDEQRELLGELEILARRAAERAVSQAVDRLMTRLGLDDEQGVKNAIRLARAYEHARERFWSAVTSGLASGLLIALGVGLIALVKGGQLTP
jgi:CheY-like chemotaxis protein